MKRLEKMIITSLTILCLSCINVYGIEINNSSQENKKIGEEKFNAVTSLAMNKKVKTSSLNDKSFFQKKDILYTCTIDVDGNINGVHIEGTVTIEGISFFKCIAIKINDIFDSSY
jgi:hypothetical protein